MVTFTSGSLTITILGSPAGLAVGEAVSGAGIVPGTTITSISGSTLTVSTSTTAASTGGAAGESLTATASVVTFAIDGTGGVVELNSDGNLLRYAPGPSTAELLDTNVSKFVIDKAGSIVALEEATTAVAAASNNLDLPQSTINVISTADFPSSGTINITIAGAPVSITYTGTTPTRHLFDNAGGIPHNVFRID